MTAGGVPAIDFGGSNKRASNQPTSFQDAMAFLGPESYNPGACSVSTKCYLPEPMAVDFMAARAAKSSNLKVLYRSAIVATQVDPASKRITSIDVVQRTPKVPSEEWNVNLSEDLPDWYSPSPSERFEKQTIRLTGAVFIEASELGDVLATANITWAQGVEIPTETSFKTDSTCGQAWTLTFYMSYLPEGEHPPPGPPVPPGSGEGLPFPQPSDAFWTHSWTWRRAACGGNRSLEAVNALDVTQQNLGNDLDSAYVLLPQQEAVRQRPWQGGVNLTALRMLEGRAYGYYHWMRNNTPSGVDPSRIILNRTASGTGHGLSKWPYLRDSRRGVGLGDFRLQYWAEDYYNTSQPLYGYHFNDSVAL